MGPHHCQQMDHTFTCFACSGDVPLAMSSCCSCNACGARIAHRGIACRRRATRRTSTRTQKPLTGDHDQDCGCSLLELDEFQLDDLVLKLLPLLALLFPVLLVVLCMSIWA